MVDRDRVALAGVVFAVLFAQVLLYPGIPDLVEALGGTPADWGGDLGAILVAGKWFLAAEFLGFVLFAGLWGAGSDAVGRRTPLVVAGALLGAGGYLALVAVPVAGVPYGAVLGLRFLQGAATIGALSLAITTLMDLPGGHGHNMGAAGIAIGTGTALGAPVGGQLSAVGPLVPLYGAALLLVLAAVLATLRPDRAPGGTRGGVVAAVAGLRARPALGLPYAFGFVDRLTAGFFALVGTVYFRAALGLDPAGTGLMLGLFFAPFALLQYPFGALSDRVGRVGPVALGSVAYGLAIVSVFLAPTLAATGAAMVAVGVFGALVAPATMALVTDIASERERGVAMGGFNVFGSLGFLAGVVGGATVAARAGFGAAFLAVGAVEVAIAVVALPFLLGLDVDSEVTPGS
ncbi:MAG: MFS transporter [Halobacteriales archaeon SW_9_67_25]|nr:MAG: MFS transporter [Halobacteriales archaeon SW_9_67_25]